MNSQQNVQSEKIVLIDREQDPDDLEDHEYKVFMKNSQKIYGEELYSIIKDDILHDRVGDIRDRIETDYFPEMEERWNIKDYTKYVINMKWLNSIYMLFEQIGMGENWNRFVYQESFNKLFPNDDETAFHMIKLIMNKYLEDKNGEGIENILSFHNHLQTFILLMNSLSWFYSKNDDMMDVLRKWIAGKMEWYFETEDEERESEIIKDIILHGEYDEEWSWCVDISRDHGVRSHKIRILE